MKLNGHPHRYSVAYDALVGNNMVTGIQAVSKVSEFREAEKNLDENFKDITK